MGASYPNGAGDHQALDSAAARDPPPRVASPCGQEPPAGPPRQVRISAEPDTVLSQQLYASKPVTWRGRGDLLQCSWATPLRGTFLVVDLWSGMGGLPIALLCAGCTFYALAAESDPVARAACTNTMPNILHVNDVALVKAKDFVPLLERRRPRAILVGGGSPCQGNSSLNKNRKGLHDPRSNQPLELCRIRDEFLQLPCCRDTPVITFLENVGSM